MGRLYEELKCGCLVSCDGGGGLIPYGCDEGPDCQFDEWSARHPLCSWCGRCLTCEPGYHGSCPDTICEVADIEDETPFEAVERAARVVALHHYTDLSVDKSIGELQDTLDALDAWRDL